MNGEVTGKLPRSRPPAEMENSSFGTSPRSRPEYLVEQVGLSDKNARNYVGMKGNMNAVLRIVSTPDIPIDPLWKV
jgi:hypothetical protein